MYAATSTCPDIAFAVVTLSQFMWNPGKVHWEASKQALRYLKATDNFKLTLGSTDAGESMKTDCRMHNQSLDVRLTTLLVRQNVGSHCA
jgi:hypothetical protein